MNIKKLTTKLITCFAFLMMVFSVMPQTTYAAKAVTPKVYHKDTTTSSSSAKKTSGTSSCSKAAKTVTKTSTNTSTKTSKTFGDIKDTTKITTVVDKKVSKYTKNKKKYTWNRTVTTTIKTTTYNYVRTTGATINQISGFVPSRVVTAWKNSGHTITVNSNYSFPSSSILGVNNSSNNIILRYNIDSVMTHELGHFVDRTNSSVSKGSNFISTYNSEKSKLSDDLRINKSYAQGSSSEYFAECFKAYCLQPTLLKQNNPKTYTAIQNAINKM